MTCNEIKEISEKLNFKDRIKDIQQILSISASLAHGMVWKEKTKSFYQIMAKVLKEVFDENLLDGYPLKKFRNEYKKINSQGENILFQRNNLFTLSDEKLDQEEWLNQKLVMIEQRKLPNDLTSKDKEKIFKNLGSDDIELINRNYNRQELNSDRFMLSLIEEEKEQLLNLLDKYGYYSITVKEYIDRLSKGDYDYNNKYNDKMEKLFKETFNNYILELSVYIANEIEDYLI